ncbi:hypothetical protein OAJ55_01835 [Candidatus Nitrosopelagicus sp.]|nr:hypothetical protein [Candidatus Nitrosopelagicus sp.]
MTCKGICSRYKAQKPVGTGRYASGQRRCQICEIFINWEGLWCPCCGYRLRTKPRNLKYKAKLRARVEADAASLKSQTIQVPQVATVGASSSDFVKTTLETAVAEGWTKTKTVEELRKSEERITIKKARELTIEAFDSKNEPVETPVTVGASSSDFVKTTLETAVAEGWTKTKTVEELRKSEERITIKKARDLVKEAFETKSEPIAIKA